VHVGVAVWRANELVKAREVPAEYAVTFINKMLITERQLHVDVRLVVEEFRLYPGKAKALSWSPMLTAEMIGALKWVAEQQGVVVVMQGADVKVPTRRQLKARGIVPYSREGGHANDALLHAYHFILKNELLEDGWSR
jgi:hypothetical protein